MDPQIHREYLVLLERWDYALRAATISDDKSELGVMDDYLHEKPILPLREYRRQQRAEERKKRQADAERKNRQVLSGRNAGSGKLRKKSSALRTHRLSMKLRSSDGKNRLKKQNTIGSAP